MRVKWLIPLNSCCMIHCSWPLLDRWHFWVDIVSLVLPHRFISILYSYVFLVQWQVYHYWDSSGVHAFSSVAYKDILFMSRSSVAGTLVVVMSLSPSRMLQGVMLVITASTVCYLKASLHLAHKTFLYHRSYRGCFFAGIDLCWGMSSLLWCECTPLGSGVLWDGYYVTF